ncbi:MAG: hypothetical protein OWV35_04700 [Firmicutes bacterium]|nr:hypothetical protein [Bacillota bacterium]
MGPAWPDPRLVRWVERVVLGLGLTVAVFGLGFVSGWLAHMGQVAAALAQLQADRAALARTHHLPPAGHPWLTAGVAVLSAAAGVAGGYAWARRRPLPVPPPAAAPAPPPSAAAGPDPLPPPADADAPAPDSGSSYVLGPLLRAFTWWAVAAFLALVAWQSGFLAQSHLLPW